MESGTEVGGGECGLRIARMVISEMWWRARSWCGRSGERA